jgi:hypothetical protein
MQQWASQLPADQRGILSNLQFVLVTDLPGDALAWSIGDGNVLIDMNAAGRGWFVDSTPRSSSEFFSSGNKVVANPNGTAGQMDLLSALIHEIGHVIGYEHSQGGTMDSTLAAGERRQLIDWSRTDLRAALGWNSTATSQKPAFPEFSIGMGKKKKSLLDPEVEGEGETLTQLDWYVEV